MTVPVELANGSPEKSVAVDLDSKPVNGAKAPVQVVQPPADELDGYKEWTIAYLFRYAFMTAGCARVGLLAILLPSVEARHIALLAAPQSRSLFCVIVTSWSSSAWLVCCRWQCGSCTNCSDILMTSSFGSPASFLSLIHI